MCGICGRLSFSDDAVDRDRIVAMCEAIVHRGPDAQGVHTGPHIGLGQRRLSIIDLDDRGVAPLSNEDGSVWVTFNGEIYNFQQLKDELTGRGHVFRTATDTEVLVHLYEEEGTACLYRLEGMFAFAIWDARKQLLFAARDRFGKKPFLYSHTASGLTFASEFRAILRDPDVSADPDFAALHQYLERQFVPSPITAFRGIRKLPAAHFLICDLRGGLAVERYWKPPVPAPTEMSPTEIEQETLRLLRSAVRKRLISDVPIGAFLSGGIDSGAVVALMAEEMSGRLNTFSMGMEGSSHDELPFARGVAARYGTEHREFVIRPDAAEVLPTLVKHFGEPFADSSALPTYYLARETAGHVTVALSGDGGDETFGGYAAYGRITAWESADIVPAGLRRAVGRAVAGVQSVLPYSNVTARFARAGMMFGADTATRYALHTSMFKPQERKAAYSSAFLAYAADNGRGEPQPDVRDTLTWLMRADQMSYLPDCLMVKVDIAAMASSLEVRSPFLDHELAAFAASIPSVLKRNGREGKVILRSALRDLLPRDVLIKPKSGFSIPVAEWFRGNMGDLMRSCLQDDVFSRRSMFQRAFINRMIDEHQRGRRDWSNRLWALTMLELWFREFVD